MSLRWPAAGLLLVGIVPIVIFSEMIVVLWWTLFVAVVVALDVLLAPAPTSLQVQRVGPATAPNALTANGVPVTQVRTGQETSTVLFVTNPKNRRVRGVLRDAWVPSTGLVDNRHTLDIPAGQRRKFDTVAIPTRRGDRLTDRVTLRTLGPLGLGARQSAILVPGVIRALPPFNSRKHLPSRLAHLRQIDGRSAVRTRGQGTEFDSLRDYVDGDDVRSIDWRATARRRNVVVRTWQPERDRHVIIVLDTSRTSAARVGDEPRLDASMDAALLLAALASRAGDRVTVLAGDRAMRGSVSPGTDRTQFLNSVVTMMAPVESSLLEANWELLSAKVHKSAGRRSLVVLLTALEPSAIEAGLFRFCLASRLGTEWSLLPWPIPLLRTRYLTLAMLTRRIEQPVPPARKRWLSEPPTPLLDWAATR
ncbi:DUF58 domain-containing protein [Ornithinimicrobium sp. INDO-MA30-4]|uniref:DUF58 domain-containing protein n=1 Tax=Ornithinimicrobium sp. INDO-MA30-4 TaxID=2908651 RepID=UPI0028830FD7|nr:DUF58 domain-containing protein [Ornithinimicrobium sp. INDO-MA30-4]